MATREPYLNLVYPWVVPSHKVWVDTGRKAVLRDGGTSWPESVEARGMDADCLQWMGTRAGRRDALEEANPG